MSGRSAHDYVTRLLVVGGGPAGHAAATEAAALGAHVTLVEDQILGGAAHLWDCIPSKAMVASMSRLTAIRRATQLGITDNLAPAAIDMVGLAEHLASITNTLARGFSDMLELQDVVVHRGRGRFTGQHTAAVADAEGGVTALSFDHALISTGSRPFVPSWAPVDGERVVTTREAYSFDTMPEHIVIVGSGVTGVEMVHIFASLGSRVTLLVSRHHLLPYRDAEVAAVLEEDFLARGVTLLKGSRANSIVREGDVVRVSTEDGRTVEGSHCLLAVGSLPNTEDLGLGVAGVEVDGGYVKVDENQRTSVPHIFAAGDVTGQMPLSSVAQMQGTKVARLVLGQVVKPLDYGKIAQAVFTDPEIASVGLEEVDAAAEGRKVRITKVPFAANPKALMTANTVGFAKVISDPATHIVLGGTVVGKNASELIAPLALAVTARVRVDVLFETLMVHPSLSEVISEAAE
jgi:dihydrolipoamide dehydrogenase